MTNATSTAIPAPASTTCVYDVEITLASGRPMHVQRTQAHTWVEHFPGLPQCFWQCSNCGEVA